ncbi:hypothetical protein L1887_28633 [Cichorium endivia]|nr:hypothetical protein L1887_28633 [Cichorium endivia]
MLETNHHHHHQHDQLNPLPARSSSTHPFTSTEHALSCKRKRRPAGTPDPDAEDILVIVVEFFPELRVSSSTKMLVWSGMLTRI